MVVYALDETSVRVESDNHRSWGLVGHPPILKKNGCKKVIVFLDNAPTYRSIRMQEFYQKNKDKLQAIPLPRYSPYMNPQENVWHYLKDKLFRPSSRGRVAELIQDTEKIFIELNANKDKIHSLAYARSFVV